MNRILWRSGLVAGVVFFCLAAYESYDVYRSSAREKAGALASAREKATHAAQKFNAELGRFLPLVQGLADDLSTGRLPVDGVLEQLEKLMKSEPGLPSMGVAFEPYAYSRDRRLYAPYLLRTADGVKHLQLERTFDYTRPGTGWYETALREGPGWEEPAWEKASDALMATYATPFFRKGSKGEKVPAGVVFVSLPLDLFQRWVDALQVGSTGWGVILSKKGNIIAGPGRNKVGEDPVNVFELAKEAGNEVLLRVAERATAGGSGTAAFRSDSTGKDVHAVYEPIMETGWSLGVVLVDDEVPFDARGFRRGAIRALLALLASIAFLSIPLAAGPYRSRPLTTLWSLVALSAVLLAGGIAVIRYLPQDQRVEDAGKSVTIVDHAGLHAFLEGREKSGGIHLPSAPVQIATGLYLQSMDFSDSHNILVSGFLWQEIPDGVRDKVGEGFILPEATNFKTVETYRKREGDVETVGWSFEASLRQKMKYSKYPFDLLNVGIRLWHKKFHRNVILVPALDSYEFINPSTRPGIDRDLQLSGWEILRSFFTYEIDSYPTDFGIPEYLGQESFPQLQFNVAVGRNLLDILVSNMIPLGVVSLMLFAVLVSFTKDKNELKAVGFNPSTALRVASGLFFVVLLAHIHLRTTTDAHEVTYLEYYYFTLYVAILAIALHSFVMSSGRITIRLLDYEHSLIPKLLFWPLLLGIQFLITVLVFY